MTQELAKSVTVLSMTHMVGVKKISRHHIRKSQYFKNKINVEIFYCLNRIISWFKRTTHLCSLNFHNGGHTTIAPPSYSVYKIPTTNTICKS